MSQVQALKDRFFVVEKTFQRSHGLKNKWIISIHAFGN